MGFGKFLKKAAKVVKKGAGLAVKAGLIPGVGALGAIATSKLQTWGENRQKLKLAAKGKLVGPIKAKPGVTPMRPPGTPAPLKPKPALMAAKKLSLQGAAKTLVEGTEQAKRDRVRSASLAKLSATKELELKISKLTAGQKEDLADEFKRQGGGTPAQFKQFLAARL